MGLVVGKGSLKSGSDWYQLDYRMELSSHLRPLFLYFWKLLSAYLRKMNILIEPKQIFNSFTTSITIIVDLTGLSFTHCEKLENCVL